MHTRARSNISYHKYFAVLIRRYLISTTKISGFTACLLVDREWELIP